MKKAMHKNSLTAYAETFAALSKREQLIYSFLVYQPKPMTDRQIMRALDFTEPNNVRPRITSLVNDWKIVEEVGQVKCKETNILVRVVRVVTGKFDEDGQGNLL
jgi:predicted DNA-binding transcriptional regulator